MKKVKKPNKIIIYIVICCIILVVCTIYLCCKANKDNNTTDSPDNEFLHGAKIDEFNNIIPSPIAENKENNKNKDIQKEDDTFIGNDGQVYNSIGDAPGWEEDEITKLPSPEERNMFLTQLSIEAEEVANIKAVNKDVLMVIAIIRSNWGSLNCTTLNNPYCIKTSSGETGIYLSMHYCDCLENEVYEEGIYKTYESQKDAMLDMADRMIKCGAISSDNYEALTIMCENGYLDKKYIDMAVIYIDNFC